MPDVAVIPNIPAHIQVPEDFESISVAIDMAADGDVILIAPVYSSTQVFEYYTMNANIVSASV